MTNATRTIIGWREWVALPSLKIPAIKAKVDTGAKTSALHAFAIETFDRNGRLFVRFRVHPLPQRPSLAVACEAPVIDHRFVTDSGGHREKRFVIATDLEIGGLRFPIEMTLANREALSHRMLLGRSAMQRIVIDPGHVFLLGRVSKASRLYPSAAAAAVPARKKKKAAAKKPGRKE